MLYISIRTLDVSVRQTHELYSQTNALTEQVARQRKEYFLSNRPYLSFNVDETNISPTYTKEDFEKGLPFLDADRLRTVLINTGKVPARFRVTGHYSEPYPKVEWVQCSPNEGTIFPGLLHELCWFLQIDKGSEKYIKWLSDSLETVRWGKPIETVVVKIEYSQISQADMGIFFTELEGSLYPAGITEGLGSEPAKTYKFVWRVRNIK